MRKNLLSYFSLILFLLFFYSVSNAKSDCDPLVPTHCMLPFPSTFYLEKDLTTQTGFRVNIPPSAVPKPLHGRKIDTSEYSTLDGFSPITALIAHFPEVSLEGTADNKHIELSLEEDSKTILIDANTGERIPHFVELDESGDNPNRKAFMIWPVKALKNATRYIVAVRNLVKEDGTLVEPSSAFLALRDNIITNNPDIEYRRNLYEDIFARLEVVGVSRDELILAWDFITGSSENLTKRLLAMRDDGFKRLGAKSVEYKIISVKDNYSDKIFRKIEGVFKVPLYLTSPLPGSTLVLDSKGIPVYQRDVWTKFTVLIPKSLIENKKKGRIVQYGHGLLGSQGEVETQYLQEIANRYGYILCATDWWGLNAEDTPAIFKMLITDFNQFKMIPDRCQQGVLNALFLMRMMRGNFSEDPKVKFNGQSVIDKNLVGYYGNSQGGILGGVYMALTQEVEKGVLGVAGSPYAILLPRSVDFAPYLEIMKTQWPDPLDRIVLFDIMQLLWDRGEPSGYLGRITENPLPNTPPHKVLFQVAMQDAQVANLGSHIYARSVNAVLIDPYARPLFGFVIKSTPYQGSGLVEFDFGAPEVPPVNIPPSKENDTHEKPRRLFEGQEQLNYFLVNGIISNYCNGACNPN